MTSSRAVFGTRFTVSPRFTRLVMSVLACLLLPASLPAQAIDRDLARSYFEEVAALAAADGGRLWGTSLGGPVMFVDRGTRELVANTADPQGRLAAEAGFFVGRLPDGIGIFNGGIDWSGQRWTMLAWPLPYGRYERQRLMAHELFHRLQPQLELPAENPGNEHLDTPGARLWLRLEWRALAAALADSGEGRRTAIADALRFRAERRRLFPDAVEAERALELNEGLSEYTGVRVGVPAPVRTGWVVRQIETADARARSESVVRNFAYTSGAGYGVLLDAADAAWARRVTSRSDLGDLLAEFYRIPATNAAVDVEARAVRYAGPRLAAEEAAREEKRLVQQAAFRARFADGATLTLPTSGAMAFSFDPNAVVPFDDGGTVYLTLEVSDAWGTLRVSEGGGLLRQDGQGGMVVVPAPSAVAPGVLRGPGWELTLAEGWALAEGARPADRVLIRRP